MTDSIADGDTRLLAIAGDVVMGPSLSRLATPARARGCFARAGTVPMDAQVPAVAELLRLPPGAGGSEAVARVLGR